MRIKVRHIRILVQIGSLAVYLLLLARLVYPPGTGSLILVWLSRLDPWLSLTAVRWSAGFVLWMFVPLLVVVVTLLAGRVFCGWFCPLGAFMMILDEATRWLLGRIRKREILKLRVLVLEKLVSWRYAWLSFVVILFVFGLNIALPPSPFALFNAEIVRLLGGFLPWALLILAVMTVGLGRIWCAALCPTGMLLSVFGRFRLFGYRAEAGCTSCTRCVVACPVGAAPPGTPGVGDGCLSCGTCQTGCRKRVVRFKWLRSGSNVAGQLKGVCLAGSSKVQAGAASAANTDLAFGFATDIGKGSTSVTSACELDSATEKSSGRFSRREFIRISAFCVGGVALSLSLGGLGSSKVVLRPPGAVSEAKFRALCSGCGRCVKVCPNNALVPMSLLEGPDVWATPKIIPRQASCNLCLACQEACPSGAIAKVPLEQIKMGTATIDRERCLSWTNQKQCWVCGESCPISAITIDRRLRPHVSDSCVGCGTCEYNCPVEGVAAIRVIPKGAM